VSTADVTALSALELAGRIRRQELSPLEVTQVYLERIERIDPLVNAYVLVTAERALSQAREQEQTLLATPAELLPPLLGVPLSIKDLTPVAGVRTTFGSPATLEFVPDFTAGHASRLERAGTIMLGKTNTPELGLNATTEDSPFPPTRNPWNLDHSAGGSSGGAGAALSALLCPLAQGSDGGGSVRIPSAACGVVGLKPTRGRISSAPFGGEGWGGLATSGPMARTVADLAAMLDIMAGPAPGDPYTIALPPQPFADAVEAVQRPLRIGWTARHPEARVDPEIATAVERTATMLASMGHQVEQSTPEQGGLWETFLTIVQAHVACDAQADCERLGPHARAVYDAGQKISLVEYLKSKAQMHQRTREIAVWFEQYDVLLCPTLTSTPPPLGELAGAGAEVWDKLERYIAFTFWVNMTGQPAMSLPLAWSLNGLPIGVQIIGRQLEEATLLGLAGQLEQALPWRHRLPTVAQ
jgi:amidase